MQNGLTSLSRLFKAKITRIILAILGLSIVSGIVFSPYIPYSITLKEGDNASYTINAPRYLEFESAEDAAKTKALRAKRAELIEPVYSIDENINKEIIAGIVNFFTTFKEYRESLNTTANVSLPAELDFLNKRWFKYYRTYSVNELSSLEYFTLQSIDKLLNQGLQNVDEKFIRDSLQKSLRLLRLSRSRREFIFEITNHYLKPNMVIDEAKTAALIADEIKSIKPFTTIYREGQPIVYADEVITAKHIEVLKQLNIYGVNANFTKLTGIFLISFFLFLLLERFLYYFHYRIYKQLKYYVLTFLVMLLVIVLARLFKDISFLPEYFRTEYLIPIPISGMLLALLVTHNISLLCGTLISILIAMMFQADLTLLIYLFFGTAVTTFSTYRKYKRVDLISSGYVVGLFNMIFIIAIGLFKEIYDPLWFGSNMVLGFSNGIISSMISLAILPYFESAFGITTSQTLLELSNLSHPLMKRLMMRAPGTYQHSLMVGNLAEAAAESIGADPILSRVGAYYHDIGKMKRPMFFTENQFSGENPHEKLSPRMSKIIISSHTKDGVELATKYKLPNILKKFILEHHGTTLVSFFYTQAIIEEQLEDCESAKEEFRYPGPKPSFKESGILMLADSVEAAIRSMDKPTMTKIENVIDQIFQSKITDDQLSDSHLSLKEIRQIKDTFLTMFRSIYHSRLDYQEEIDSIIEQTKTT